MTWAKLSDSWNDDPDLLVLFRGARLLQVEALVYACKHLTDGHLRAHVLRRITDEPDLDAAVEQLVAAGFWEPTADGYRVVDFLADQPSRGQVVQQRGRTSARQDRFRRHREGDHAQCVAKFCDAVRNGVTNGVTDAVSNTAPSRPDPSRP